MGTHREVFGQVEESGWRVSSRIPGGKTLHGGLGAAPGTGTRELGCRTVIQRQRQPHVETSEASWVASEGETEAVSKENNGSHPKTVCVGGGGNELDVWCEIAIP